jgi:hypothetical protein
MDYQLVRLNQGVKQRFGGIIALIGINRSRMIEREIRGGVTIGRAELVEDGCILALGRRLRFRLE